MTANKRTRFSGYDTTKEAIQLRRRLTVEKSEDEVRDTINEGNLGQNVRGNDIGKGQRR